MNTILQDAALEYAAHGVPVFALVPGRKIPVNVTGIQEHGCLDATTDAEHIRDLWARVPGANIGLATGVLSGVDVVDYDGQHAPALAKAHGLTAPATRTVRTPRGGFHVYIAHDGAVPQKAAVLTADCACVVEGKPHPCAIDTRSDHGYVVAPPSIVDGRTYEVIRDLPVAPWSEFIEFCRAQAKPRPAPRTERPLPSGEGRIARIKAAWSVEDLAERLGTILYGQGDQLKGKCPLHREQQGQAFVIWRGDQRWRCFGKCGIGGDVIDLWTAARERGVLA